MKKLLIAVALIIGVGAGITWSQQRTDVSTNDRIVIGAPLSLSGTALVDGENIKRGLDLARDDLAKRGIAVEIVYEDDGTDPKRTVSALQKMIATNKPDAIIGPTWSFLQDAATPVLVDAQLVSFSPANTSEFTTESAYSFYGATKNSEKEQPLTTWLRAHNKQRVAIIVDKSPWGESNRIPFAKAASNAGATVVMTEELPFGSDAENMPTALAKAVAAHADVILMTGYEEGVTVLVKRMQEQNVRVPLIIASDLPKSLIKRGLISKQPTDQLYTITTQPSDEFIEKFTAKYGFPPGNYADRAYDGLMLIVEALQKKSDTETLADYLHNKTNYRGYAIRYDFDHIGDIVGGQWIIEQL